MRNRRSFKPAAQVFFSLGFAWAGAAAAQTPPAAPGVPPAAVNDAARQADQIQREQQLRQQEQINRDARPAAPPTQLVAPAPATPSVVEPGRCREVREIALTGAARLSAAEQRAVLKPFVNRCLSASDVEALLGQVTYAYIKKGFAAARAYVPGQDLSTGRLTLLVVEGRTSDIKLAPSQRGTSLAMAFPGLVGQPVNLRDLEQGLDQLNRLSSNGATLDLQPGAAAGDTIVMIRNRPTKRWHVDLSVDDYGVASTGRTQGGLTLSYDSPLGLDDFITYTRRQSYLGDRGNAASDSDSVFYSIPYGYLLVSAGASRSAYKSRITTALGTDVTLSGGSDNYFVKVDRTVLRTQTSRLVASATLTAKTFDNFFDGVKLQVSSRKLTTADIGLVLSTQALGGAVSAGLTYSRGLDLLGALVDAPGIPGAAPHAQFDKVSALVSYFKPLAIAGRQASFSSVFTGQYAPQGLYSSEQVTVGGIYSARGFFNSFLANDSGFYIRNDLSIRQPLGVALGRPASVRPYVGVDAGAVGGRTPSAPSGGLAGAAAGATFALGEVALDVFTAHALAHPANFRGEGFTTFARLSASF